MVDRAALLDWLDDRFGDVIDREKKDIKVHSVFDDTDRNYHLSLTPDKGEYGLFNCWKTGKGGVLPSLVMKVDGCDWQDAVAVLNGHLTVHQLAEKLPAILGTDPGRAPAREVAKPSGLDFPPGTELITEVGTNNHWRKKAVEVLDKRKIPLDGLHLCFEGMYKGRVLIPYYDRGGKLVYWNTRTLGSGIRYLGPDKKASGVGKEDVVFCPGPWPEAGSVVVVCEGEFNAMSVRLSGLFAVACGGKHLSETQAALLRDYALVVGLDNDEAGRKATVGMVARLREKACGQIRVCPPPAKYNDWNDLYRELGAVKVKNWVLGTAKVAGPFFCELSMAS